LSFSEIAYRDRKQRESCGWLERPGFEIVSNSTAKRGASAGAGGFVRSRQREGALMLKAARTSAKVSADGVWSPSSTTTSTVVSQMEAAEADSSAIQFTTLGRAG
jgi:hypothetical protein